jgi:hypothetical protein
MLKIISVGWVAFLGSELEKSMTENEIRKIAEKYVVERQLNPCSIVSIRKFDRKVIPNPSTLGDEWVVQFQFQCDEGVSTNYTIVVIDDASGEPQLMESL